MALLFCGLILVVTATSFRWNLDWQSATHRHRVSVIRGFVIWRDARAMPAPEVVAQVAAALERWVQARSEQNRLRAIWQEQIGPPSPDLDVVEDTHLVRWLQVRSVVRSIKAVDQMNLARPSKKGWVASWQPVTGVRVIAVSCWLFLPLLAVTSGFLWYRDRRRIPRGHCQACGYNLTGNTSGVCPECGQRI